MSKDIVSIRNQILALLWSQRHPKNLTLDCTKTQLFFCTFPEYFVQPLFFAQRAIYIKSKLNPMIVRNFRWCRCMAHVRNLVLGELLSQFFLWIKDILFPRNGAKFYFFIMYPLGPTSGKQTWQLTHASSTNKYYLRLDDKVVVVTSEAHRSSLPCVRPVNTHSCC